MRLREKKALRTRRTIMDEAMKLFASQGFTETTMESIAEAAELSPSTVYRYFPSKDLIVLASFQSTFDRFTTAFEEQPADEPIERALGTAIEAVLEVEDSAPEQSRLVRSIIDQSPMARAKLWDHLEEQRVRLGQLIGNRLGLAEDHFEVIMTARIAILIIETAADVWRSSDDQVPSAQIARDLTRVLSEQRLRLPNSAV